MLSTVFTGLLTGLSLIIVIGVQNALVLRQGLRREHVGVVVAVCSLGDLLLIGAGTAGMGRHRPGPPGSAAADQLGGRGLPGVERDRRLPLCCGQ